MRILIGVVKYLKVAITPKSSIRLFVVFLNPWYNLAKIFLFFVIIEEYPPVFVDGLWEPSVQAM